MRDRATQLKKVNADTNAKLNQRRKPFAEGNENTKSLICSAVAYIEGELPQQIRRVVHWGCRASSAVAFSKSAREMMRVTCSDKQEELSSQLIVQGCAWAPQEAPSQYLLVSNTITYSCRYYDTNAASCCKIAHLSMVRPQRLFHAHPPLATAGCSSWQGVGKGNISFD